MLLSTAAALLLVAIAVLTHAFFSDREAMIQDLFTQAQIIGEDSTAAMSFNDYAAAQEKLSAFDEKPNVVAACLYRVDPNDDYSIFTSYTATGRAHEPFPPVPRHQGTVVKNGNYVFKNGHLFLFYFFQSNDTPGAIYIESDMTQLYASLWHYSSLVALFTFVALAVTFVLAARLQQVISRPIFHLAQTAKVVSSEKNYAVRAVKESSDELGNLIDGFNEMLSQIQERDAALHRANDELEQRVRERTRDLEQQFGRISLLNQITQAVTARQDQESILSTVLQKLEDHLPVAYGSSYRFDAGAETLNLLVRGPKSQPIASALKIPDVISLNETVFRPCLNREMVYLTQTGKHNLVLDTKMAGAGFNSIVAAPLFVEEKMFGLLVLIRREVDAFSRAERDFLRGLSEHVAMAIHQVQLYQDLQKAYNDLRQSQQAAMQQERLKALGQMASGVAHDINNALSPVVGFADLIAMSEPALGDSTRRHLHYIKTAGEDIAHIVKRLREFYRPRDENEPLMSLKLEAIAKQVIDMMQPRWRDIPQVNGINIEMRTVYDPSTPEFPGIESEVREAFTNLILNAVDAMPKGGTITIRTLADERPGKNGEPCRYAILSVSDTGVGMDEVTQKRCLEPFFSTKGKRGTGLGLAMVYGALERHEGKVEIESEPGRGTVMRLLFPVRKLAVAEPSPVADDDTPPGPYRILCVDDEPALRALVQELLEHDGHDIEMADGGQAGINAFRAAVKSDHPFDAVITDLGMPLVDGNAVARAVKAESAVTPVIMLTGWGAFFRGDGDVPSEVDGILSKPPRIGQIRSMLRKCVEKYKTPVPA